MMRARVFAVCLAGVVLACGKSSEKKEAGAPGGAADSTVAVPSAIGASLAAKGFKVVQDAPAPAQRGSRKASALVYQAAGRAGGGVVYVTRPVDGVVESVGWHWYFADAAPDSAVFTEINRDGLWDVRVYFGERTVDMIQGESFSLLGGGHAGTAAMNGPSSAAGDLWKCFDGDSTTAWRSPKSGAFVEIPLPLGVERGELRVQLGEADRPSQLEVYAGERKIQTVKLADENTRQSFPLDPAVRDAASLRIEVEGGSGDAVAISELEIR